MNTVIFAIYFKLKMKSSILIILTTLLTTAILAPSVIALTNIDEKTITIDFNEEEKKEEKKENAEIDFLFSPSSNVISLQRKEKIEFSNFYLEGISSSSVVIFLPPPRLV